MEIPTTSFPRTNKNRAAVFPILNDCLHVFPKVQSTILELYKEQQRAQKKYHLCWNFSLVQVQHPARHIVLSEGIGSLQP